MKSLDWLTAFLAVFMLTIIGAVVTVAYLIVA